MPPRRASVEAAVRKDLRSYPADIAGGAIARTMLVVAQRIDAGGLDARDLAQLSRELRLAAAQLRDMAPGEVKGDDIDELRQRREKRQGGQ